MVFEINYLTYCVPMLAAPAVIKSNRESIPGKRQYAKPGRTLATRLCLMAKITADRCDIQRAQIL